MRAALRFPVSTVGAAGLVLLAACATQVPGGGLSPGSAFPAPHPSLPVVLNQGGPVQRSPVFVSVTWAGDALAPSLDSFVQKLGPSATWETQTALYAAGAGVAAPPVHILSAAPKMFLDSEIGAFLAGELDGTHPEFGMPSLDSNYVIFTPAGTVVTGSQQGCVDFLAFHSAVTLASGQVVPYSVVPRCAARDGLSEVDSITSAASHEMAEVATDPDPRDPAWAGVQRDNATWEVIVGGEIADLCVPSVPNHVAPQDVGFAVSRVWSNQAAVASHDPCVPRPDPAAVYFNSAPVLPDDVDVRVGSQRIRGKGIRIPVGGSATIELDLFSDAATSGPWSVAAIDLAERNGGNAELMFSLDSNSGENGDKIHLTINALRPGTFAQGQSVFLVVSKLADATTVWPVLVQN